MWKEGIQGTIETVIVSLLSGNSQQSVKDRLVLP
jgi:hypothetical protein